MRRLAWMVVIATPIVATSRSRNVRCSAENGAIEPSSMTPRDSSSNWTGSTATARGTAAPTPERIGR